MPRGTYDRTAFRKSEPAVEQTARVSEPADAAPSVRANEARRERRLRDPGDLDRSGRMKLAIPREVQERLAREGKTARWVLDTKNRLADMHNRDWDVTPGVDPVPSGEDGHSLQLHEKYKDWFDADQLAKEAILDQKDEAIRRGEINGAGEVIAQNELNAQLTRGNRIR